jgi:hypothetical protein
MYCCIAIKMYVDTEMYTIHTPRASQSSKAVAMIPWEEPSQHKLSKAAAIVPWKSLGSTQTK